MSPPPSQLLWSLYQTKVKRAMHQSGVRTTSATLANTATQGQLLQQRALVNGNPAVAQTLTTAESFTGAVPRTLKGSKQYWRLAFVQVMAMTIEYGVPEFFATFTANEMGWTDLRRACDGASFGSRPVEATRHYHHRWQAFKSKFLTGKTPIGHIEHIWYRHEEQARGSLHVHAAIWVRRRQLADGSWASGATPEAIVAMRPRPTDASSPLAHRWRTFVTALQLHLCQEGCHWKHGKRIDTRADGEPFCKGGYPRRLWSEVQLSERDHRGKLKRVQLDEQGERYEYRAELEEDLRISPYVPLWLLAWGANMNIQFMTATSFLSYISKYVPKPEPSTRVEDTAELRARDNRHERQVRYLNARKVGAPEAVFDMFEYKIKEGARIVHLSTQTPAQRRRCLHRKQPSIIDDEDADDGGAPPTVDLDAPLRFYDGLLEKYVKRPRGVHALDDGEAMDFEQLTYPQFCRLYDVVSWSAMTATARNRGWFWRPLSLDGERRPEVDALGAYAHASTRGSWVVRRLKPQPLWWDWMMPSKHGQAYYYQKLLLTQPFRCAEPRSFVTLASQSANFNVSGSMREECVLRGVIDAEDELATLRHDAHERHMTSEAMTRMLAQETEYRGSGDAVLDAMNNEEAAELGADDGLGDAIAPEDLERFNDELRSTAPPPPAPRVVGNVWYKSLANGEEQALVLNAEQLDAYEKMKTAGSKQLLVYLSGQGGTGKSTLIQLLTLYWRSLGLRVLLTASSGKAARLIGGHTVHTAFKLHSTGFFLRQGLEGAQGTRQFNYLATVDIVIIDEISMLSAECFNGINTALNYVVTRATAMRGLMSFGNKSIFAVGDVRSLDPPSAAPAPARVTRAPPPAKCNRIASDAPSLNSRRRAHWHWQLYQLPAVERALFEDQVYVSELWGEFHFLELTTIMRLDEDEREFAELLSRARRGWQHLTEHDWALLESRVCTNHCAQCESFEDVQMLRPPGGRRRDEVAVSHTVWHCPCDTLPLRADGTVEYRNAACVLASRRAKINELNEQHAARLAALPQCAPPSTFEAEDTCEQSGRSVTTEEVRALLDDRLSGLPRRLTVHVGQLVLLTVNRRNVHAGFVNGQLAVVLEITGAEVVVKLLDEEDARPIRVRRSQASTETGSRAYTRSQFPLVPAFAMTYAAIASLERRAHHSFPAPFDTTSDTRAPRRRALAASIECRAPRSRARCTCF